MKEYNHLTVEKKWQKEWAKKKAFKTEDPSTVSGQAKKKFYILDMFPYPSGEGLHVGHPKGYIATDIVSRMKRMQGFNVLHPMGFDAFGLPAENYALKMKVNPMIGVAKNVERFKKQLEIIGLDYDWSREVNTTDPKFYKWTQWIFLKLLEKGLAYESYEPVNWCPVDKTVLANEDVEGGKCERCGAVVEKKPMRQWVLKITDYADRMLEDLDALDWPESIKESQRNWIGRSEGVLIKFPISDFQFSNKEKAEIEIFTTRPDTLFGATYVVLAPEHKLIKELWSRIENKKEVEKYIELVKNKPEIDRTAEGKEKTGVELRGVMAINPATKKEVPVWVADYVLSTYGTGAIMAVPAHDERDFQFAKKYRLLIKPVILRLLENSRSFVMGINEDDINTFGGNVVDKTKNGFFKVTIPFDKLDIYKKFIRERMTPNFWNEFSTKEGFYFIFKHKDGHIEELKLSERTNDLIDKYGATFNSKKPQSPKNVYGWLAENDFYKDILIHTDPGSLINSGKFDGMDSEEAKKEITKFVGGKWVTKYKLRDWVFSRQRYWGEPIPVLHDGDKIVPVPEKDLPVKLPKVKSYEPTGTGESPLANIPDWINVKVGKKILKRENNTMPQWAGSSWYYLRYMDPDNTKALVDKKKEKYWNMVDLYVGGAEHATRHLIYARFWHKFLYDIGVVADKEPFKRLQHVGLIMASDGRKMSKRWGNVINPDTIIKTYGADSLRMYEMFMGPFDQSVAWGEENIVGVRRFLERVWKLSQTVSEKVKSSKKLEVLLHKTIKKVSEDVETMAFNTAISSMMILLNEMEKHEMVNQKDFEMFLKILSPFAPHITGEIWSLLGHKNLLVLEDWPKFDPKKMIESEVKIVIQVNGKVRSEYTTSINTKEEDVVSAVKKISDVKKWLLGKEIKKVIFVPNRLVNFVTN